MAARAAIKAEPSRNLRYDVDHLGARLRELRLGKGLSVHALAKLSRAPASTISKIENGQLKPSLVHAINLAQALGENLGFLVEQYRGQPENTSIVRAGERNSIAYPEMGLTLDDLSGNFVPGALEARLGRLAPGAHSGAEPMHHPGDELCHVISGRIRYVIEGQEWTLSEGDSIHFKCDLPHRWENAAPEGGVTEVLWVFSDGLSF